MEGITLRLSRGPEPASPSVCRARKKGCRAQHLALDASGCIWGRPPWKRPQEHVSDLQASLHAINLHSLCTHVVLRPQMMHLRLLTTSGRPRALIAEKKAVR